MSVIDNSKRRDAFVRGILATAAANGVSKATIKREAFSSYATGNRRIEHNNGELTLTDLFNIAAVCRVKPDQLIKNAADIMAAK